MLHITCPFGNLCKMKTLLYTMYQKECIKHCLLVFEVLFMLHYLLHPPAAQAFCNYAGFRLLYHLLL